MKKIIIASFALAINSAYADQIDTPNWGLERISNGVVAPMREGDIFNYNATNHGTGVDVYILDSGINSGKSVDDQFSGRLKSRSDFSNEKSEGNGLSDCNGHGTHVAGIVGGNTTGVAKEVNLHSLKIVSCAGGGSTITSESLSNAFEYLIENNNDDTPAGIVNISSHVTQWTNDFPKAKIDEQINTLIDLGFVIVAAAGNDNFNVCGYPARHDNVISVGATDKTDTRWISSIAGEGSAYGNCVDLFAPGVDITSVIADEKVDFLIAQTGTSAAAPIVSGIAAQHFNNTITENYSNFIETIKDFNTEINNKGANSPNRLAYSKFTIAPVTPPKIPSNLHVTDLCFGDFRASWAPPAGDVSRYELQAYTTHRSPWMMYSGANNFKVFSTNEATYLKIKACNAEGCSPFSNSIKVRNRGCR